MHACMMVVMIQFSCNTYISVSRPLYTVGDYGKAESETILSSYVAIYSLYSY